MLLCDCQYSEKGKINIGCVLNGILFGVIFALLCEVANYFIENPVKRQMASRRRLVGKFMVNSLIGTLIHIGLIYYKSNELYCQSGGQFVRNRAGIEPELNRNRLTIIRCSQQQL